MAQMAPSFRYFRFLVFIFRVPASFHLCAMAQIFSTWLLLLAGLQHCDRCLLDVHVPLNVCYV